MTNYLKVFLLVFFALLASACSSKNIPSPLKQGGQTGEQISRQIQQDSQAQAPACQAQQYDQEQARERRAYERTNAMPLNAWNR